MKNIKIKKLDNGFLVEITKQGVQSLYDRHESYIAKDEREIYSVISEHAFYHSEVGTKLEEKELDDIMEDLMVGHNFEYARKALLEWHNKHKG